MMKPESIVIRSKILGVLIQDARLASGKSQEECAQAIGVTVATFDLYECGEQAPSLPELEALAYYLQILPEHFWQRSMLSGRVTGGKQIDMVQVVGLRQRMIGAMLRQARSEAGHTLEYVAERAALSPVLLESSELGEAALSVPQLEALANVLDRPIQHFMDRSGPVGAWTSQQRFVQAFLALTPDLQDFVSRPVNQPYLELAKRLSEMSVDKLRAVGEGILEITL